MSGSLRAEQLVLGYGGDPVVRGVDLTLAEGEVTAVVGPNGCGKSTLLRGLGRLLRPVSGRVVLGEDDVRRLSARELGRRVSMLPQSPIAPEGIVVADLVGRGRYAHQSWLRQWSAEDERAVAHALTVTDTAGLATRALDELSGGQRQRVWLAMVVAQQTDVLLLDEPITFLDLAHQVDVLELLVQLNREEGRTVVMVLHDLNLAARYADHVVAMREGVVVAEGAPRAVIDSATVRTVFGLDAVVAADPVTSSPLVVPLGRPRGRPRTSPQSSPSSTTPTPTREESP